jgi:hypothetical protein
MTNTWPRTRPTLSSISAAMLAAACGGGANTSLDPSATAAEGPAQTVMDRMAKHGGKPAPISWTTIATENADFKVNTGQTVRFGAARSWVTKTMSGTGTCSVGFFGSDPAPGTAKTCQVDPASGTPNWVALAQEGQTFNVGTHQWVRYGAEPHWKTATLTGQGNCSSSFFGTDPSPGVVKSCQYDPNSGAPIWTKVANEGSSFTLAQNQIVRYGSGSSWTEMAMAAGPGLCSNSTFGVDPDPGVAKECDLKSGAPVVIVAPPPIDHSGSGPVVDLSKIPLPTAEKYTADRMQMLFIDPATGLPIPSQQANLSADIGAFREVMNYAGMNQDDPIALPGQPGMAHLHTYAGNLVNAFTSTANIRQSPWTVSAGGTINKTSAWTPSVIDTRSGTPIAFSSINLYYKGSYALPLSSAVEITPVPLGLRMISGNASNTDTALGAQNTRYICYGPNGENPGWKTSITAAVADGTCKPGATFVMEVGFPACWDGVNLDSPDHKSHMSFYVQDQTAPFAVHCPSTHPKIMPVISINANYPIGINTSVADWRLSSDKYDPMLPAGLSGHGDYMMGWDPAKRPDLFQGANDTVVEHWTQHCLHERRDCHNYLVGDNVNTLY